VNSDPLLRRLETSAIAVCAAMAVVALLVADDRVQTALAVLSGGLLAGVSYWLILSGAGAIVRAAGLASGAEPVRRANLPWIVVKLAGRYALLALLAYVMIARLRLPPLGLLAGVSSIVAAASVEALRSLLKTNS
jgi:hypothetical protein